MGTALFGHDGPQVIAPFLITTGRKPESVDERRDRFREYQLNSF